MYNRIFFGLKFALIGVLFFFLAGGVTMLLWNWLMPAVFGLPVLSFLQAFGLLVLARILVGGFSSGGGRHWGGRYNRHAWTHKMRARWEQMSPEERERWKVQMKERCGNRGGLWEMPPTGEAEENKA